MNFKHAWFRGGPLMKQDTTVPIEMIAGTVVSDNPAYVRTRCPICGNVHTHRLVPNMIDSFVAVNCVDAILPNKNYLITLHSRSVEELKKTYQELNDKVPPFVFAQIQKKLTEE